MAPQAGSERGKQVHLSVGTNDHFHAMVPERTKWEWQLAIKPVTSGRELFTSFVYDSADHISSFYLWNEAGYGSTGKEQHSEWSLPVYRTEGNEPTGWKRFRQVVQSAEAYAPIPTNHLPLQAAEEVLAISL